MNYVELRHLLYFEAVARHGGFTRAAEALHVSQPSVSAQIRLLEKTMGVSLLARTTRSVTLTPAGEQLLRRVRRVMDELDAARHEMTAHAAVLTGRIRVGATLVVGDFPLPDLLSRYRLTYPGVSIELVSGMVNELLEKLSCGDLDLVVGPEHASDLRFRSFEVAEESFVLITSPDTGRAVTGLHQVAHESFVCLPRGSGLHQLLKEGAAKAGFTPNVGFETHSPQSVRELVSSGSGVAILAESSATSPGPPVRVHRIRDAPDHPPISVFRRKGRSDRATQALTDLLAGASTAEVHSQRKQFTVSSLNKSTRKSGKEGNDSE